MMIIRCLLFSVIAINGMHILMAREEHNAFSPAFLKTTALLQTHTMHAAANNEVSSSQEQPHAQINHEQQRTRRERWYRYLTIAAALYAAYHLHEAWHDTAYAPADDCYWIPAALHAFSKQCGFLMRCCTIALKTTLYRAGARACVWVLTISWDDVGNLIFHPFSETSSILCC